MLTHSDIRKISLPEVMDGTVDQVELLPHLELIEC